jgi:hypothetical protein
MRQDALGFWVGETQSMCAREMFIITWLYSFVAISEGMRTIGYWICSDVAYCLPLAYHRWLVVLIHRRHEVGKQWVTGKRTLLDMVRWHICLGNVPSIYWLE